MKLSDELIELRRTFRIGEIEKRNQEYFTNLRNELKSFAGKGLDTYAVYIDALPKDVSISHVEEWTELNGMEFDWECHKHPFQICF